MTAREKAAQAAAEGDTQKAAYWTRIAETVDLAPPLGPGQIATLRALMYPIAEPVVRAA